MMCKAKNFFCELEFNYLLFFLNLIIKIFALLGEKHSKKKCLKFKNRQIEENSHIKIFFTYITYMLHLSELTLNFLNFYY
jgi:hypothetical protein